VLPVRRGVLFVLSREPRAGVLAAEGAGAEGAGAEGAGAEGATTAGGAEATAGGAAITDTPLFG